MLLNFLCQKDILANAGIKISLATSAFFFMEKTNGIEQGKEFPSSPVLRIQSFHCRGPGFDSWLGN